MGLTSLWWLSLLYEQRDNTQFQLNGAMPWSGIATSLSIGTTDLMNLMHV
jgi:hypothetical protein